MGISKHCYLQRRANNQHGITFSQFGMDTVHYGSGDVVSEENYVWFENSATSLACRHLVVERGNTPPSFPLIDNPILSPSPLFSLSLSLSLQWPSLCSICLQGVCYPLVQHWFKSWHFCLFVQHWFKSWHFCLFAFRMSFKHKQDITTFACMNE